VLTRKAPVKVRVTVTNAGAVPEAFFLDPRLTRIRTFGLDSVTGENFLLPLSEVEPEWLVPTHASSAQLTAKGSVPIELDWGPGQGDPDLFAGPAPGDRASASFEPEGGALQPGEWVAGLDEIGPYKKPAAFARASAHLMVTARAFDSAMTPATGDLWQQAVDVAASFAPLTIAAGQTRVITLTLRPNGPPGSVVRGDLYVDDFASAVPPGGAASGDELVAIPYAYKIK
jgi:hypothetical protein